MSRAKTSSLAQLSRPHYDIFDVLEDLRKVPQEPGEVGGEADEKEHVPRSAVVDAHIIAVEAELQQYKEANEELRKVVQQLQTEAKQRKAQLKAFEDNLSLETKAREGMQKKFGLADHESNSLKTNKVSLIRQNGHFREKIKEHEEKLHNERTTRLELMHEVEELRQHVIQLETIESQAREECRLANVDALKNIQELESARSLAKSQQGLLNAQVAEMNSLQMQLTASQEAYTKIHAQYREAETKLHQQMLTIRAREQEISRLRRDLVVVSTKHTDKARAYSRRFSANTDRVGVNTAPPSALMRATSMHGFRASTTTSILSPMASQPSTPWNESDTTTKLNISTTSLHRPQTRNRSWDIDHAGSLFVGQGLGLTKSPGHQPDGSPKERLRRIMTAKVAQDRTGEQLL